jgi:hypothetical protein
LFVDASDYGWGAIHYNPETGGVSVVDERWKPQESFDTRFSAWSEPEAAYRALCRFVPPTADYQTVVVTDSTVTKWMIQTGYSPSYLVNGIALRIKNNWPSNTITAVHIPGRIHPCDFLSRGVEGSVDEQSLRRIVGTLVTPNLPPVLSPG